MIKKKKKKGSNEGHEIPGKQNINTKILGSPVKALELERRHFFLGPPQHVASSYDFPWNKKT